MLTYILGRGLLVFGNIVLFFTVAEFITTILMYDMIVGKLT